MYTHTYHKPLVAALLAGLLLFPLPTGFGLAWLCASGSGAATFASIAAFYVSLVAGAVPVTMLRLAAFGLRLVRGSAEVDAAEHKMPGAFLYLPITFGIFLVVGVVVAWFFRALHPLIVVGLYAAAGAGYGLYAWWMARSGYLEVSEIADVFG
jgi:hypothetical protein